MEEDLPSRSLVLGLLKCHMSPGELSFPTFLPPKSLSLHVCDLLTVSFGSRSCTSNLELLLAGSDSSFLIWKMTCWLPLEVQDNSTGDVSRALL